MVAFAGGLWQKAVAQLQSSRQLRSQDHDSVPRFVCGRLSHHSRDGGTDSGVQERVSQVACFRKGDHSSHADGISCSAPFSRFLVSSHVLLHRALPHLSWATNVAHAAQFCSCPEESNLSSSRPSTVPYYCHRPVFLPTTGRGSWGSASYGSVDLSVMSTWELMRFCRLMDRHVRLGFTLGVPALPPLRRALGAAVWNSSPPSVALLTEQQALPRPAAGW
jgi:hypothetical protein